MKSKKLKKRLNSKLIFILLFMIVVIVSSVFAISFLKHEKPKNTNQIPTPTISINYSNIEQQLSKNSLIKDLPKDSDSILKFYNLKSDGSNPDLIISINSNYLSSLTNKNFCEIIKKAYSNGDVSFETSLSKVSLAWKFKSMMKYKSCLGL